MWSLIAITHSSVIILIPFADLNPLTPSPLLGGFRPLSIFGGLLLKHSFLVFGVFYSARVCHYLSLLLLRNETIRFSLECEVVSSHTHTIQVLYLSCDLWEAWG
jgi:hypothetical protein